MRRTVGPRRLETQEQSRAGHSEESPQGDLSGGPSHSWQPLADQWEKQILPEARPFYIAHAIMAVAAAGRTAAALRVIEALHRTDTPSSANPGGTLALPLCEALLAFTRGNYSACVESLVRRAPHRASLPR
jgi:hypothetical protein